jgi:hypothetical protein
MLYFNLHYSGRSKGEPVTSRWWLGGGGDTCISAPVRSVGDRWVSVVIAYAPTSLPPGYTWYPSGFGGIVVSMLASGIQDRGFASGRSRRIFRAKKSSACLPSEVK